MAAVIGPVRSSSFLPTIKCSDCSAEIEISRMGDHVCLGVSLPASIFAPLDLPFIRSNPHLSNPSTLRAKNVQPPPVNDPAVETYASLLHIDRLPTTTPANLPPKLPQNSLVSGRQSPLENPNKHKTLHPSISPSSDASRSQECAFPPFPTSKSRSATPTTPSEPVQNFATHHSGQQALGDWNSLFAPSSSQGIGGSVLHRMEKILTGPVGGPRSKGHTRTPTMSSSKDFTYQPIGESGKDYNSRPSTAGSYSSRKPSLSNISKVPRSKFSQTNTDLPRLPIASGNAVRAFPTGDMEDDKSGELVQRKMSIERLRQENRSRTYPLGNLAKEEDGARRPSAPSLHVKRPSVAAAIRPLHEIGSVSTFKPSRSLRGRPRSQVALIISESAAMPIEHRTRRSQKADNAPAVPIFHLSSEDRSENLYRAPAGSTSSHGSSKSGAGSVSSASTPSLSESPPRQKQQPLDAGHNTFTQDFRFEIKAQFNTEEPLSPRGILPAESSTLAPPPVRDPAIHSPRFPPITPFNDCFAALPIASNDLAARPDHTSPPSLVPALKTRRAPFGNKGQCKGCGEFIVGKSVSSADGRLTGRYHKSCFKCATCKEPFRTADFYIHDNHPYCQRHYHQLNQSLCVACDCGIEGQYVETENRQKFHQDCFTCRECKNVLRDHYFEINGEAYCEQHAVRETPSQPHESELASEGKGNGTGAQQRVERRQTRLLMMTP